MAKAKPNKTDKNTGKLKIGDNWNAITIIAYSQNNPLKAIAEFVENSIDAQAQHIQIIRGKHKHEHYIKIIDDGSGIDDFSYVATHIGDSIKRKLKKQGTTHIQGEFGIGLLSFWTVGEHLVLTSTGSEGITRRMKLVKNNPGYTITQVRDLFQAQSTGTELYIAPILPGIKQLSGEKIQNYLASELRDRISRTGVAIRITDKSARKELIVEPRKFTGQLIHNLPQPASPMGEIYCELYLNDPSARSGVGLYKLGTRVLQNITELEVFSHHPWTSEYLEGIIDVSFLQLTPGTRSGIIFDEAYDSFLASMEPVTQALECLIQEQRKAEEEKASKTILKRISKALREALLLLPSEEYRWLQVQEKMKPRIMRIPASSGGSAETESYESIPGSQEDLQSIVVADAPQKSDSGDSFSFAGPLYAAQIYPSATVMSAGTTKNFRVKPMDKQKQPLDDGFSVTWELRNKLGALSDSSGLFVEFTAGNDPGIEEITARVTQGDTEVVCSSVITITKELFSDDSAEGSSAKQKKGLPGYTVKHAPGELWRSTYDDERSIIIINSGHADYLFASKNNTRKLRYITKLYAKELVLVNFPEADKEKLLERLIELQIYTEENL